MKAVKGQAFADILADHTMNVFEPVELFEECFESSLKAVSFAFLVAMYLVSRDGTFRPILFLPRTGVVIRSFLRNGSSILLQARGWLVGKVSLGRNGPIRITSFESSRCRSESSTFGSEDLIS